MNSRVHLCLARLIPSLLVLTVSLAIAATGTDGNYAGMSTGTGGTKPFCKGTSPLGAVVKGAVINILSTAADGSSNPGIGKIDAKGGFVARKKIKGGGTIIYDGTVQVGKISGTWKGPSCNGVFEMKK